MNIDRIRELATSKELLTTKYLQISELILALCDVVERNQEVEELLEFYSSQIIEWGDSVEVPWGENEPPEDRAKKLYRMLIDADINLESKVNKILGR